MGHRVTIAEVRADVLGEWDNWVRERDINSHHERDAYTFFLHYTDGSEQMYIPPGLSNPWDTVLAWLVKSRGVRGVGPGARSRPRGIF